MTRVARGVAVALLVAGGARAAEAADAPGPGPEAISFDEAVRRAVANATLSIVAAEEVRRAQGLLEQARSNSLPALGAGGVLTRLDANRVAQGRIISAASQEGASATLTVPVFAPGRWYQWSHGTDSVEAARAGQADVARTAALTAARAYLSIVAQKRALDVAQRAVENAKAHYDFAKARRTGGVGTALDELRTEQQLGTAEAQRQGTLTALDRSREALGVATGGDRPLDAAADPDLNSAAQTADEAMRDVGGRADLRAAEVRSRAAQRVAGDSWADWLPTLLATGQAFYQNPATLTTPETGWQAQLVLSFPLYEGGLRMGQRRERDALASEAQAQLEGLVKQARSEVRSAVSTLEHAEEALAQSRRAATSAGSALQLVSQAYRAGATTSLDVTDAEQRARDADTAAVVSEDAVRQARLDLLAATGHFP